MRRSKQEILDDKLAKIHEIASDVSFQLEQHLGEDSHVAHKVGDIMCTVDEARYELEEEWKKYEEARTNYEAVRKEGKKDAQDGRGK